MKFIKEFENKSPDFFALEKYGFIRRGADYVYTEHILQGQFALTVKINGDGADACLIDVAAGEEYTLHLVGEAAGEFIGSVRAEYSRVLADIAAKCFRTDVFRRDISRAALGYALEEHGDSPEFLWKDLPDAAVLRRKDTGKWYAVLMKIPLCKLRADGEGTAEIIDMRYPPEELPSKTDGELFFPAYHMNKKRWITVLCADGVHKEELFAMLDYSYANAK